MFVRYDDNWRQFYIYLFINSDASNEEIAFAPHIQVTWFNDENQGKVLPRLWYSQDSIPQGATELKERYEKVVQALAVAQMMCDWRGLTQEPAAIAQMANNVIAQRGAEDK